MKTSEMIKDKTIAIIFGAISFCLTYFIHHLFKLFLHYILPNLTVAEALNMSILFCLLTIIALLIALYFCLQNKSLSKEIEENKSAQTSKLFPAPFGYYVDQYGNRYCPAHEKPFLTRMEFLEYPSMGNSQVTIFKCQVKDCDMQWNDLLTHSHIAEIINNSIKYSNFKVTS